MPETLARFLVTFVQLYVGAGFLFAGPFVTRGVNGIDPLARTAPWSFRLLIVAGRRLRRLGGRSGSGNHRGHRDVFSAVTFADDATGCQTCPR